jgi:hypothetical protein
LPNLLCFIFSFCVCLFVLDVLPKPLCGSRILKGFVIRAGGGPDSETFFGEWPHMCALYGVNNFKSFQMQMVLRSKMK